MFDWLVTLFNTSAAVGVVGCLISESNIAAPIRNYFGYQLLFCPICMGFWLALPSLAWDWRAYFLVVAISNAWMLVILHVYEALDRANEDTECQ
jgi:hypothetical protein